MTKVAALRKAPPVELSPSTLALQRLASNFTVELQPYPEQDKALAFQTEAKAILARGVSDAVSHGAALTAMREGKRNQRGIKEHWMKAIRWLEERQRDIRMIMAMDLELVEPGVTGLSQAALAYETVEKEKARIAQEAARRKAEDEARAKREEELARLEREAAAAEQQSEQLSDRERAFVQAVFQMMPHTDAARHAGYKDPQAHAERLMRTPKITYALEALRQTSEIRAQQAAVAQKPIEVTAPPPVQSTLAKVAGTRTVVTHKGEALDSAACIAQFKAGGEDAPPADLFMVNPVKLNEYARAMHGEIERWAGIRYVRTETKAG